MAKENTTADIHLTIARASLASNVIYGRSKLNSFQLVRGYLPGIAGLPPKLLTQEVLDAYTQTSAYRAINAAFKAKDPKHIPSSSISPGDDIFVFHKSTNKSVDIEWIVAKVENVRKHYVECRRSTRGKPMRVA